MRDPTPPKTAPPSTFEFQSTGPLRDPTSPATSANHDQADFNPQVPCGTRLWQQDHFRHGGRYFNPQVPCGTRQGKAIGIIVGEKISIHRSLAGPDRALCGRGPLKWHFNPQVPCGTRQTALRARQFWNLISIHRSLAGPDIGSIDTCEICAKISIHRSLAGPDLAALGFVEYRIKFQSTGPLRDPTYCIASFLPIRVISIHRSLAGPDDCSLAHSM